MHVVLVRFFYGLIGYIRVSTTQKEFDYSDTRWLSRDVTVTFALLGWKSSQSKPRCFAPSIHKNREILRDDNSIGARLI